MITQISIRQLRELKGYNQSELAKRLKISQPSYSQMETGLTKAKHASYLELSTILEVDVKYLKENKIPVFIFIENKELDLDPEQSLKNDLIKILLNSILYQKKLLKEILAQE